MPTSSAQFFIAALPGTAYTFSTLGLMDKRQAIACSRPPFPITQTFIITSQTSQTEQPQYSIHHLLTRLQHSIEVTHVLYLINV